MKVAAVIVVLGTLLAMASLFAFGLGVSRAPSTGTAPTGASAGAPNVDLTRHRGVIVEGEPGTRGSLSVTCQKGTVVGGGFSHGGKNLHVIESRPDGIYAWQVSWVQSSTDDAVLYVYASCIAASG